MMFVHHKTQNYLKVIHNLVYMNLKDIIPTGVSFGVLFRAALDSKLRIKIIDALNERSDGTMYKQDLLKAINHKHYKTFHEALKKLYAFGIISFLKEEEKQGRPVKIILNKPLIKSLEPTLAELRKKHKIKV